jgi:hypothetical protein
VDVTFAEWAALVALLVALLLIDLLVVHRGAHEISTRRRRRARRGAAMGRGGFVRRTDRRSRGGRRLRARDVARVKLPDSTGASASMVETEAFAADEQRASAGGRSEPRRYRIHYEAAVKR